MKKNASAGDMELMQGIMSAIRVARARYGVLEDSSGFVIEVGGSKVPVVNSNRFPSPACLSRSLVEGAIPEDQRPDELKLAKPADPVVAMTPRFKGMGYDTVLFHELIHSQQILRMWRRRGIDLSGMSHRDVVEGWRDRDIPMPKSQQVDEEYGSVHAEVHAYMMHVAYSAIRKAAGLIEGGVDPRDAEASAVSEASREAASMMKMLRGARATLADDVRFSAFMRGPAAEHGVDMAAARSKSRWRMGEEEWSLLTEKMGKRIEYLVRSMVRQMALRSNRRRDARIASSGRWTKVATPRTSNKASETENKMEHGWKKTASGGWEMGRLAQVEQQMAPQAAPVAGAADIESVASGLEFLPTRKKPLVYRHWSGDAESMPPMSYMVMDDGGTSETFVGGEKETSRGYASGDVMVSGPEGERYTMSPKKFSKNYEGELGGDVVVEQSPRMVAQYDGEDSVRFTASWGEEMVLHPEDYLVKEGEGQYYRIEKGIFKKTYGAPGS